MKPAIDKIVINTDGKTKLNEKNRVRLLKVSIISTIEKLPNCPANETK